MLWNVSFTPKCSCETTFTVLFRNKELMMASGVLPILQNMIVDADSVGAATALYLNLSCLEEAKSVIGTTVAGCPFLDLGS